MNAMASKECCRTCRHCVGGQLNSYFLCRLRKVRIHPGIASMVFCHHWTMREASLPLVDENDQENDIDRQLEFGRVLSGRDI